jgi:hypothetical protein
MKTTIKHEKRVLGHAHKNVLGFIFVVDHPETPNYGQ